MRKDVADTTDVTDKISSSCKIMEMAQVSSLQAAFSVCVCVCVNSAVEDNQMWVGQFHYKTQQGQLGNH